MKFDVRQFPSLTFPEEEVIMHESHKEYEND